VTGVASVPSIASVTGVAGVARVGGRIAGVPSVARVAGITSVRRVGVLGLRGMGSGLGGLGVQGRHLGLGALRRGLEGVDGGVTLAGLERLGLRGGLGQIAQVRQALGVDLRQLGLNRRHAHDGTSMSAWGAPKYLSV